VICDLFFCLSPFDMLLWFDVVVRDDFVCVFVAIVSDPELGRLSLP
jgi:hypothetical protein